MRSRLCLLTLIGSLLLLLLLSLPPSAARAEELVMDAGRLAHALDRVSNTTRVLYIAAHPDDENTRLLAYLANGRHVTAQYMSMTRGGGGQNLIGREQDALLDVLRTQELLSARRLDGAQQRFSRMRDFGFSKSAQETLAIWDHDEALADVVFALRSFRPDVVITRFDEQPPNHGHHTASAVLAREAFSAAADAKRFPEQFAFGVSVWQATRLLHNVPNWHDEPPPAGALTLDVGAYDTRLGLSYGELAARSRSQHKSQGFGAAPERGPLLEHFVHLAGVRATGDILDGIPANWTRFGAAGASVDAALLQARQRLHRDWPEHAVSALVQARRALEALPADDPRVRDAQKQTERLALLASGVFVRASAARPSCTPGSTLPLKLEVVLRRAAALQLQQIALPDSQTLAGPGNLTPHEKREISATVRCPADAAISTPYWLAEPALPGHAVVKDPRLLDDPAGAAPLSAALSFVLEGQTLHWHAPLVYAFTDRVQGERERSVLIVPPATITPTREAVMFANGAASSVSLRVRAGIDGVKGRVLLELPTGYSAQPSEQALSLQHAGDESVLSFLVTPSAGATTAQLRPVVEVDGQRWSYREDIVDYPHVPLQSVLQPAKLRLQPLKLVKPHGLIGYVEGSGDTIAADLAHVGAAVETLSDTALMQGNLARFSAIVLGVRSYNTRDVLRSAQPRLMRYVQDGGTLVTQYVTRSSISPFDVPVGPYPLEIGRGRVTDEHAAMLTHAPESVLLRGPNRITAQDFDGWVQERGLYFAETWDKRYTPVFEVQDPDEAKQLGSLLVAQYGRGRFVYTGLSFFRQLPAGVPGAYRLFVNLLAPVSAEPKP
jgi:LmbE family N-acetylglucosaminyl deacetylase